MAEEQGTKPCRHSQRVSVIVHNKYQNGKKCDLSYCSLLDNPSSVTQLHVAISKTSAKVVIDCKTVGEKPISAAGNITTDGMEVLGRMVRSRDRRDNSASVRHGQEPYQSSETMCWLMFENCTWTGYYEALPLS